MQVPERAVYPTFFSDQAADISPQLSIKIVAALKQVWVRSVQSGLHGMVGTRGTELWLSMQPCPAVFRHLHNPLAASFPHADAAQGNGQAGLGLYCLVPDARPQTPLPMLAPADWSAG